MSISLFSHDVNPSVDPRLCRKSNSYVARLVHEGRAFMLDERRAQLYAPTQDLMDSGRQLLQPAITRGRTSCGKVTNKDGELVRYVVKHFSYPVPARGARNRPMHVRVINKEPMETKAAILNEPPKRPLGPWRMPPATEGLST
jgi:hypothetical protein